MPLPLVVTGQRPRPPREEEMRRRGLDPALCRTTEDTTSEPPHQLWPPGPGDEGQTGVERPAIGTAPGHLPSGKAQSSRQDQTRPVAQANGGARQTTPASDGDLPSSTPAPPSLNVPIVTRGRSTGAGKTRADQISSHHDSSPPLHCSEVTVR